MKSWIKKFVVVSSALAISVAVVSPSFARPGDADTQMQVEIDQYTAKIKANPRDFDSILQRGILYRKLGKLDLCEADGVRLIQQAPELSHGYWILSRVSKDRGDYLNSLKWIREASKREPNNAGHLRFELICLFELGRYKDAISRSVEIEKKFPRDSHIFYYRAMSRINLKEPKDVVRADLLKAKANADGDVSIIKAVDKELACLK